MVKSADQKLYEVEQKQLKKEIEDRTGKSAVQLYGEREKRVRDAIEMKVPDMVPIAVNPDTQAYTGILNSSGYYDPIAFKRARRMIAVDFEPDMADVGIPMSGGMLTALDVKNRLWPGGPLPETYDYQAVEGEWMKAGEYDIFLKDPADFVIRYVWPRLYGTLAPLAKLPPIGDLFSGFEMLTTMMASPEFVKMAKLVAKAGKETTKFRETLGDTVEDLAQLGFPIGYQMGGVGGAPFDTVSSALRGMQGTMLDMFRQPDKLLAACDMIMDRRIARAVPADPAKRPNPKKAAMPLWRGDKSFMSEKQFEKFYWPGLKRAMQATIDLGYIAFPFFEAEYGNRLERLLELPKGKFIASIEAVDAVRAKDILKDHACLYVRIPLAAKVWTFNDVESFTKNIIDKCGKGGGLMLHMRLPVNGTKEQYQKLMKSIREYSKY
jgi:hypothetical protein